MPSTSDCSRLSWCRDMTCRQCGLITAEFCSEIAVHTEHSADSSDLPVLVFPRLIVCMECGFGELVLSARDLGLLTKSATRQAESLEVQR